MSRPQKSKCYVVVENQSGSHDVRVARFGNAPLVHLWVHQPGAGGTGIVLDYDESVELVEGLNDLLDELEAE